MSPASDSPVLPEQFGPYIDVRPLVKGGMGAVYHARDPRLERDVVLKVCLLTENPEAKERFRREARAAASLAHTNLCPVYEFDVRDGIAYLSMAFVEGPTLNAWVVQRGGLSQREAALMVAKLALAMQVAHDGGVIHRDLKPTNVAINKRGEPIILDFGLACQMNDSGKRLTQFGAIYGTPAYMAPEQAGGDPAAVGPAADVYSLGVILYELLTGVVPFTGAPLMLLFKAANTPPLPPSQRNHDVDATLEAICLKALAKKPENRQRSMKELARALAKAARTLSARPEAFVSHLQQTAAPTQQEQIATDTIPPVATAALDRPRTSKLKAPSPTVRKRREWLLGGEPLVALALVLVLLSVLGAAVWYLLRVWQERQETPTENLALVEKENLPTTPTRPRPQPPSEPLKKTPMPPVRPQDQVANPLARPAPILPSLVPRQYAAVFPPDPVRRTAALLPDFRPPKAHNSSPLGMKFVHLSKGTFYMGGGGGTAGKRTEIKEDFEIATHTVTQGQWQALMNDNPSKFSRTGANKDSVEQIADADLKKFPVENVSWDMTQDFIEKLNEKERASGWVYRLPTEAEWEYACRGGALTEADCSFHFYLDEPTNVLSAKQANFDGAYPFDAPTFPSLGRPTMVDDPAYPTNRIGLHHMHGNVWQWCSDRYEEEGSSHVFRGGSWFNDGNSCRAGYRFGFAPTLRFSDLGFRLVRALR